MQEIFKAYNLLIVEDLIPIWTKAFSAASTTDSRDWLNCDRFTVDSHIMIRFRMPTYRNNNNWSVRQYYFIVIRISVFEVIDFAVNQSAKKYLPIYELGKKGTKSGHWPPTIASRLVCERERLHEVNKSVHILVLCERAVALCIRNYL